jgi:hypothetical protein
MICIFPYSTEAIITVDVALGGYFYLASNDVMRLHRREQDFRLERGIHLMALDVRGYQKVSIRL